MPGPWAPRPPTWRACGGSWPCRHPDGFAITTAAYRLFLIETGLAAEIDEALAELSADDPAALEATGRKIRARIMESPLPATIRAAIEEAAGKLANGASSDLRLAVRSSAIGEDGEISFAGQYTSVLNVPIGGPGRGLQAGGGEQVFRLGAFLPHAPRRG